MRGKTNWTCILETSRTAQTKVRQCRLVPIVVLGGAWHLVEVWGGVGKGGGGGGLGSVALPPGSFC